MSEREQPRDVASLTGTASEGASDAGAGDAAAQVTMLEQGLWRRLSDAKATQEAAQSWAPLMFGMLDTPEVCCVFLRDAETGRLRTIANFPDARIPSDGLLLAAENAVSQDRGVVRGAIEKDAMATKGGLVFITTPLSLDGTAVGAVGIEVLPRDQADLRQTMRRLQWGAAWMRDALRREDAAVRAERYAQAVHALNTVVGVAEQQDIATAARAAATDLATRFDCDRVSIGFRRFGHCRVAAISHSAQFGKRMNLVRLLGAAMDEAIDQRGVVIYPDDGVDPPMATHRHEKLAQAHGIGNLLSVPLYAVDRFIGAIVFERPASRPFTQNEAEIFEAVTSVLAPVLEEKRSNDRWLITKTAEVAGAHFTRLVGPGKLGRKAFVLAVLLLGVFFWFARGMDRVAADAVVEGAVQRTIAAPFDGFIAESLARAGDEVAQGALLVRLDDRDLVLERLRLVTQLQRQRIEYDSALAARDRAEANIRRNQIEQTEAQIALVDKQLDRTRLTAPFDGLVTSGDLSQSIGSSVARGDALLSVAPAGEYRVALKVDERRVSDIRPGQPGSLLVTALPDAAFPITVRKITPVAEYGNGATSFRVEATLDTPAPGLQPGMDGVAKVDVDEKRLIAVWTRPLVNWARIWAWRWLGLE
ncbi:efflux RND transporter periplasmic adaptor subunit [Brevirhabdus sp.]|uniref:efflux RND transporter periplasmic adaptor subunit n=1 Tax=Brevirhabdus sp. TaxID=2004514 RepID=UPI00405A4647